MIAAVQTNKLAATVISPVRAEEGTRRVILTVAAQKRSLRMVFPVGAKKGASGVVSTVDSKKFSCHVASYRLSAARLPAQSLPISGKDFRVHASMAR